MSTLVLPPKRVIADELLRMITSGEIEPSGRLPSMREIAQSRRVALNTAKAAFDILADWGAAFSTGPGGTRAAGADRVLSPQQRLARMLAGHSPLGYGETSHNHSTGYAHEVPQRVRDALQVPNGRIALRRGVVRRRDQAHPDGFVVEVTDVWHGEWVAERVPQVLDPTPIPDGTVNALARANLEIHPRRGLSTGGATRAEAAWAELMGVEPGSPVLRLKAVRADPDGRPLEYLETGFPEHVEMDWMTF